MSPHFNNPMPASADERYLRRLLAMRVDMPHAYYDDGEAQGQEHGIVIDFMREPVADIDAKLRALNIARLRVKEADDAARMRAEEADAAAWRRRIDKLCAQRDEL
jgi:hypothetical protein